MFKKTTVLFCLLAILISCTSCDSAETPIEIKAPVKIAVEHQSIEAVVLQEIANDNGYEICEYTDWQGAVIDVENEKADYILLQKERATQEFLNNAHLKYYKNVDYKLKVCAVVSKENEALAEKINNAISVLSKTDILNTIENAADFANAYTPQEYTPVNGELKILYTPIYENRLFYDEKGNIEGKEIAFINALCEEMGVLPQTKVYHHANEMYDDLSNGEGDIVMPFFQYEDEYEADYIVTNPYSYITFALYEKDGK